MEGRVMEYKASIPDSDALGWSEQQAYLKKSISERE